MSIIEFHHDVFLVKVNQTHKVLMKAALTKGLYQLHSSFLIPKSHGSRVFLVQATTSDLNNTSTCTKVIDSSSCNLAHQRNKMSGTTYFVQLCTNSSELTLWHNKLGHLDHVVLAKLIKIITGESINSKLNFCDACHQGKTHHIPHLSTSIKTTTDFQLVHLVWGP